MTSVSDIFSVLGGPSAVARMLRVRTSTASEMKRRGTIPAEYWRELIIAARQRGAHEITADALAALHARPGAPEPDEGSPGLGEAETAQRAGGHFSRFYHLSRPHFASREAVRDHISALRDEWERR